MENISRKNFLKTLAVGGMSLAVGSGLTGCSEAGKGKVIAYLQNIGGRALLLKTIENPDDKPVDLMNFQIYYRDTSVSSRLSYGAALVFDEDTLAEEVAQLQKVIDLSNENEPYGINTVIYKKENSDGYTYACTDSDFLYDFNGIRTGSLASNIKGGDYIVFDSRRKVFLDSELAEECGLEYKKDEIAAAQAEELEEISLDDESKEK